eukprot:4179917-Amphidinium_carterae.2
MEQNVWASNQQACGQVAVIAASFMCPEALPRENAGRAGKGVGRARTRINNNQSFHWGPFVFARIFREGAFTGMGCTCGIHRNDGDKPTTTCQKAIDFGKDRRLSQEMCILQLKRWLYAGHHSVDPPVHGRQLPMWSICPAAGCKGFQRANETIVVLSITKDVKASKERMGH